MRKSTVLVLASVLVLLAFTAGCEDKAEKHKTAQPPASCEEYNYCEGNIAIGGEKTTFQI